MMTAMAGRIGTGKRVHRILRYVVPAKWGTARCGWAGKVALVADGVVSCEACVRADHAEKAREPSDTEASGMGRPTPSEAGRV